MLTLLLNPSGTDLSMNLFSDVRLELEMKPRKHF